MDGNRPEGEKGKIRLTSNVLCCGDVVLKEARTILMGGGIVGGTDGAAASIIILVGCSNVMFT